MAIDQTFKVRVAAIITDLEAISALVVKSTPGQLTMLDDILGTPAEALGNEVLNELQNSVLILIPRMREFQAFVDPL